MTTKKQHWNKYHRFMSTLKQVDEEVYRIVKSQGTRYLPSISTEDFGKISYGIGDKRYSDRTRIKTTLGKFISKRYNKQVESNRIGMVGRKVCTLLQDDSEHVQVLKGKDIAHFYTHSEISSCMSKNESFLELYVENTDEISLLTYVTGDEEARALLWHGAYDDKGTKYLYLDRIYSTAGSNEDTFGAGVLTNKARKLANEAGLKLIIRNTHYSGYPCDGDDITEPQLWIAVDHIPKRYPYLDSFYSTDGDGNFATHDYYGHTALETHGNLSNALVCYSCDDFIDEGESYHYDGECYCEGCFHDRFSYCSNCAEAVHNDDVHVHEDHCYCVVCYNDFFAWCDQCEQDYPTDDVTLISDCHYCNDCRDELFTWCYHCKEYHPNDKVTLIGDWPYCDICKDELFDECITCGEHLREDERYYDEDGDCYCHECNEERKAA